MEFLCRECRLPHRILPPQKLCGPSPLVGRAHGVGPTECANCMALLHLPDYHGLTIDQVCDYKMGYNVDIKPPKMVHSPKTSIVTLKDMSRLREIEEVEDCFILEYDTSYSITSSNTFYKLLYDYIADLPHIVKQDEMACRDYPHPRHLCVTHPFHNTRDHYIHCNMCYCYVCDELAPCEQWTKQSSYFKHCEATPEIHIWRDLRNAKKRNAYNSFDEAFLI